MYLFDYPPNMIAKTLESKAEVIFVESEIAEFKSRKDHTHILQSYINKASKTGTKMFLKGTFYVNTISIDSKKNIHFILNGKIISIAPKKAVSKKTQYPSQTPTISINNSSNIIFEGGTIYNKYYEAISAINSSDITIRKIKVDGMKLSQDYDGIYLNDCDNVFILNSTIKSIAKNPRKGYGDGQGIAIFHNRNIKIANNTIYDNAANGIYVGSGNKTYILNNKIFRNLMSGIQLNFNLYPKYPNKSFSIIQNKIYENSADGIDLNNTSEFYKVYGFISKNKFSSNGWINNEPTQDGSGIGTYINIGEINISDNESWDSARFGLYIYKCLNLKVLRNVIHKTFRSRQDNAIFINDSQGIDISNNKVIFPSMFKSLPIRIEKNSINIKIYKNTINLSN